MSILELEIDIYGRLKGELMGKIVKLKNANNEYTYPVTKTEAVYIEDNKTTLKDYLDAMAITETIGPAQIVKFNDGANGVPVKELILNIESIQSGSGDPSPTNVRPITGWTATNVTRAGKNLLNNDHASGSTTVNGITFTTNADKSITANGTATANALYYVTLKSGTTFPGDEDLILNGCPAGGSSKTYSVQVQVQGGSTYADWGNGITLPSGRKWNQFLIIVRKDQTVNNLIFHPMVRFTSIADDTYEPYSSETFPITFPSSAGTIYGGMVDSVKGTLMVTHTSTVIGDLSWTYDSEHTRFSASIPLMTHNKYHDREVPLLCNQYYVIEDGRPIADVPNNSIYGVNANTYIYIMDSRYTDPNVFKTQNATVQIVYELHTPQTYILTPIQINTLLGINNIYSDTGSIKVTYKANLAKYITNIFSSN